MLLHRNNGHLVREFLQTAHSNQVKNLDAYIAAQVKCWGFPEFNPGNRDEYRGFFNYIADVFAAQTLSIERLLADDSQVLVRFRISGKHHEEFMGLPATNGELEFTANALFRLEQGIICEVWMYNKHILLKTPKGHNYSTYPTTSQGIIDSNCAIAC